MWELIVLLFSGYTLVRVFSALFVVLLLSSYIPRWKLLFKYRKLPPGPFSLPLVGYIPFLDKEKNYLSLKNEAEKYGPVISFYVGSCFVVVIDDYEAVTKAFNRDEFLSRSSELLQSSPCLKQNNIGNVSGPAWKEQKKLMSNALKLTSTEDYMSSFQAQISQVVLEAMKKQGKDIDASKLVELAINNAAFRYLYGKTFEHSHRMIGFLGEVGKHQLTYVELSVLKYFFPWIGTLMKFLLVSRRATKAFTTMDAYVRDEVIEHETALRSHEPRNFLDFYLLKMQRPELKHIFNVDTMLGNVKVQLVAASETTRNTLVWFFLLMAKHPEIQRTIQEQMDSVLGREREPVYEDRKCLPFLEAAILESMRFRSVSHLTIPRTTYQDTTLCGYDIPKDTVVFFNISSHFLNPKYWRNPDRFEPERFLSEDKTEVVVPQHFIPFSYGKRSCPGERLASVLLFVFAGRILQLFRILPPESGVCLDVKVVFANGAAHPFVRFQSRE